MRITKCAKISFQATTEQAEEARAVAAADTVKIPEAMVRIDLAVIIGRITRTVAAMRTILKTTDLPDIITTIGGEGAAGAAAEATTIITITRAAGALPRAGTHPMAVMAAEACRSTPTAITLRADASLSATWPSKRSGNT